MAGVAASWRGPAGGRTVVELNVRWKKAFTLEPDWKIEDGHVIEVQGRPTVRTTLQFLPPADFQGTSLADFMVLDADPLQDIRNTESIRWIVANGRVYDGTSMDEVAPTRRSGAARTSLMCTPRATRPAWTG